MNHPEKNEHHHHILETSTILKVGGTLLLMTAVTVGMSYVDLGRLNFPLAMLVATFKASLVAMIFMNLKYDAKENAVIFITSFLFLAIFITFTVTDMFFRGDVYVKPFNFNGNFALLMPSNQKSQFKNAWVSSPELIAHGKTLFQQQCVACHGDTGHGDGVASGSLTPKPRNFTSGDGWKNGRKPSQVFGTLKNGVPGSAMSSFATLPADDRWSLAHYVLSLGPPASTDTKEDLAKVGVDPSKEGGGTVVEAPTVPVNVAMKRMIDEQAKDGQQGNVEPGHQGLTDYGKKLNFK